MRGNAVIVGNPFRHFSNSGLRSGLIAILIVQLLYWFAFTPLFKVTNPPKSLIELSKVDYSHLPSPDENGWREAKFESRELPIEDCCIPGYRGLRAQFSLDRLPPQPLGMVMRMGADNYQMKLNGTTLYKEGSLYLANLTYHGNVRTVFRLPEGVLRVGDNELDVIMVRDAGAPYFNFAPPRIADYATLSSAFKYEMFTLNEFMFLSIAAGAILAFLLAIVIVRGGSSPLLFWLMILTLGWTARLSYFVVTDPPIHGIARMFYLFFFVNFVPLAWLNLANHFSGRPVRWIPRVSVSAFAVLMVILGAIFYFACSIKSTLSTGSACGLGW